jgi:hypothetical protein
MDIHHDLQVPREGQPENATVSALAAQNLALREALDAGMFASREGLPCR